MTEEKLATGKTTVRVTRRQVDAAQALIEISGGAENVDPLIVKIAAAAPNRWSPRVAVPH